MNREDIRSRLEKVIINTMNSESPQGKKLDFTADLKSLGINSLQFIKIVVAIETEFSFEFENEELSVNNYQCIDDIVNYIEKSI